MKKILVIEDEKHIAEGIKFNLTKQGYEIELCFNGIDAVNNWKKINPDMIILDLMLPELDGFKVLEHIRLYNEKIPILILSARDAVEDKIRCFKKGVDETKKEIEALKGQTKEIRKLLETQQNRITFP